MPVKTRRRELPARRKLSLRRDASIETGRKKIAKAFGLPLDSIALLLPKGRRRARKDKSVYALLRDYNW